MTVTSTLTDSSQQTYAAPTSVVQSETMNLGYNAVIQSGVLCTSVSAIGATEEYNLNETANDTYSSSELAQQTGVETLTENLGYTGSSSLSVSDSETTVFTSTDTAAINYGINAAVTGGSEYSSFYETGSGLINTLTDTGSNTHQVAFSGAGDDSSTFGTTLTATGSETSSFTLSETAAQYYGNNDVVTTGSMTQSETYADTLTQTYLENSPTRVNNFGSGNQDNVSYTASEYTTIFDSQHDSGLAGAGNLRHDCRLRMLP